MIRALYLYFFSFRGILALFLYLLFDDALFLYLLFDDALFLYLLFDDNNNLPSFFYKCTWLSPFPPRGGGGGGEKRGRELLTQLETATP